MNRIVKYIGIFIALIAMYEGLNAQLPEGSLHTFKFYINTKDSLTHKNLSFTNVLMDNGVTSFEGVSDSTGNFFTSKAFSDAFKFYGGKWGYLTKSLTEIIDSSTGVLFINMVKGYYDDFLFANNWKSSIHKSVSWQRVLADSSAHALFYPKTDDTTDFGNYYMQTGSNTQLLDTGTLYLMSPLINLAGYRKPLFNFSLFITSRKVPSSDSLTVFAISGIDTVVLDSYTSNDTIANWVNYNTAALHPFVHDTGHILFKAISHSGHLKVGLDKFYISDESSHVSNIALSTFKPCDKNVRIKSNYEVAVSINTQQPLNVALYNIEGKQIYTYNSTKTPTITLPAGMYFLRVKSPDMQCVKAFGVIH